MTADEPSLAHLLEAARADCPESLRPLLAKIVRTLALHDERLTTIEDTAEIKRALP